MLPPQLLNSLCTVKRRTSTGRDALNNPTYGAPTSGSGWTTVYNDMPARLAFSNKNIRFSPEGERLIPSGTMYYSAAYSLQEEDRLLTPDGIEYVVSGIVPGYNMGNVVTHFEALLTLP